MRERWSFWRLILLIGLLRLTTAATVGAFYIQGRVADETGAAVTNLQVNLISETGESHLAVTDEQGNYSDAASPGIWTIRFNSQELKDRRLATTSMTRIVSVQEGAEITTYDIHLLRTPYDIHVRLVHDSGELYATGSPDFYVQSMIDGQRYQLQGVLGNGEATVAVASGSWSVDFNQSSLPVRVWGQVVNVTSESVEATFVLRTGNSDSRFFGRIVDETGQGIPNFALQFNLNGEIRNADADGHFDFTLPAGSLSLKSADPNYFLATTLVSLSPTQPVERAIIARRATSGISVTLNFPGGSESSSMSVWLSTRIAGSSYQVELFNSTSRTMRLPAFPGTWTVNAAASGFMALPPKTVEVGAGDAEVAFDFQQGNISTNTIQGRIVFPSGAPLRNVDVFAEGNPQSGFATSDEEGKFTMNVPDGKYFVRIMQWSPMVMKIPVEVKHGAGVDLGTIELPDRTAKVVFTFVDESGAPIQFSGYNPNQIHATLDTGTAIYELWDDGLENQRSALLTPGVWKIEAESHDEEFALAAPVMLDVEGGDMEARIVLRRLETTETAPVMKMLSAADGSTFTLRTESASAKYVDIESTTDFREWNYYSTQPAFDGSADLVIPVSAGIPILFFRAVNADLPTE